MLGLMSASIAVGHDEEVDLRLDLARELFEHEMLVLHLGAELGRLEQAFAVPDQSVDLAPACRQGSDIYGKPLVEEREIVASARIDLLGVLDQPVVLGVEDVVDGGQADVLVDAAVAGDEVRVEQLVVVSTVRPLPGLARPIVDVAVGELAVRDGVVGDVDEEGWPMRMAPIGNGRPGQPRLPRDDDIVSRVRNAVRRRRR